MSCLYIVQQGSVLKKSGNRLVVTKGKEIIMDIPIFKINQVVLMGKIMLNKIKSKKRCQIFCVSPGWNRAFLKVTQNFLPFPPAE